jgi:hypothetical protein
MTTWRRAFKAALIYLLLSAPLVSVGAFVMLEGLAGMTLIIDFQLPEEREKMRTEGLIMFTTGSIPMGLSAAILFKLLSEVIADEVEERVRKSNDLYLKDQPNRDCMI